jgi:hypothetical protein
MLRHFIRWIDIHFDVIEVLILPEHVEEFRLRFVFDF